MTDSRVINDDMLREVVISAGGDWLRATAWLTEHATAVSSQLRANGRQAYSVGLTGTPGYLAGRFAVLGVINAGDLFGLFDRARSGG